MARQTKTKLLKLVCKQAELTLARFRGSSSTNKTNQTDKNLSFINKTGERFRKKLAQLSVGTTLSSIKKEWIIIKQVQLSKLREQCLCGRPNLKFVTYLKNTINNKEITAGNCCLLTFKR
ncbi:unnamed protein product [Rotaria sordida]|uniref:Uncharacterized protein n=1 Tax=Rotaria sordida TaxID=392033 RepID=A0A815KLF9_9BILA|nr:unnamed protein product [Rotaria sordida]CAF3771125.1 unnamed protein product [Rotaria sordida]